MDAKLKRQQDYDKRVIHIMLHIYCRAKHNGVQGLCAQCVELEKYCFERIEKCPLGIAKTTCVKCPHHCYSSSLRQQIRDVMRFSGPRLVFRNPIMAFRHLMQ